MVTKPTGRKPGRPRKPLPPPMKRRARGSIPPEKNPNRYALAAFEACARIAVAHGAKRLALLEQLVTGTFGEVVPEPDNIARFLRGEPCQFWLSRVSRVPNEAAAFRSWRYKHAFRPPLALLRNKLDHLLKSEDAKGRWHRAYVDVWEICISLDLSRIEEARRKAASVGESDHFERELRPRYFPNA
jgi:hypothetical protein